MKLKQIYSIIFLIILSIAVSNQCGFGSMWKSFKRGVNNTANTVATKTKKVFTSPPQVVRKYSQSPRQLVNRVKKIGTNIPSIPKIRIPKINLPSGATQFLPSNLIHKLDRVFIPKLNKSNPYRYTPAQVRMGTSLPVAEQEVIKKRITYTKPALENFLGQTIPKDQNLRIAFCGSGGGYRAMLSTVGFLVGAQKIGLLDTALYMSALSGSTWALGPWTTMNMSIEQFKEQLISKTQRTTGLAGKELLPPPSPAQFKKVLRNLELKYLFHEPISSVDLWGAIIANRVFEPWDNRQNLYLSNQKDIIADGRHIFPIYTAVNSRNDLTYNWFEFTPYEIGSPDLKAFTPTWAFGRKFINGKTPNTLTTSGREFAPEQNLGYYLGIFGSAYTVDLSEILGMMNDSEDISDQDYQAMQLKVAVAEKVASKLVGIKSLSKARISPAKVLNYTYGMSEGSLVSAEEITLVDAGLAFNVPTPPLLRPERNIDVIFIFDSSGDIGMAGELKKAERYAKGNGIPFPEIDYSKAKTQAMSIFRDETNPSIPTIFYMPLIKDMELAEVSSNTALAEFDPKKCVEKDYCSTFNFKYDENEFRLLTLLTEISVTGNSEKIRSAFKAILDLKYS
jgi:phospholipase A2